VSMLASKKMFVLGMLMLSLIVLSLNMVPNLVKAQEEPKSLNTKRQVYAEGEVIVKFRVND
jgi:hypothetical protein